MRFLRLLACAAFLAPAVAFAGSYPDKPIRLVVPFPPGGSGDAIARPIAAKLGEVLGQPVVVDNRGGANGIVASSYVAKAAPDGYTLELGYNAGPQGSVLFFFADVPYDPVKDFTAIAAAVEVPIGVVVHPSIPVNSMQELIDYAKKRPGDLAYGSPGIGSAQQIAVETLTQATGAKLQHVPYKGSGPVIADLLGGQIPMALITMPGVLPYVESGRMKVLAVIEPRRYHGLPNIPTVAETVPGFTVPATWAGIFGPAGMPPEIVNRLNTEINKVLKDKDVREKLEAAGLTVLGDTTPSQFAEMVKRDIDVYRSITTKAGIVPE